MVPGLREVIWSDVDHFMLDAGLSAFQIDAEKPGNKKAIMKMHGDWMRIKRQLMRNNSVPITFQNDYLCMVEDYPIERLETCFAPIQRNADVALDELFKESGISEKDISAVVLLGENCEYPFVQKHLQERLGKKICRVNLLECVAARGCTLDNM